MLPFPEDIGGRYTALSPVGLFPLAVAGFDIARMAQGAKDIRSSLMANVWRAFPFFTLMIFAKLCTIPNDQMDAAELEGARGFTLFRFVLLPFIRDVLLSCIFLCFIWTFNAYDIMKVMTNGGPAEMTTTMSILIQREAFSYFSLSNAATMSVYAFCIMSEAKRMTSSLRMIPFSLRFLKKR